MTDLVERLRASCDVREAALLRNLAADEITRLRAQVETLEWQLTMESIDTTCHCAAKSAADCGCPGAVWPEDVLRAENGRLREALHTAREGLAHIKAVARLHAEGADTALEGRS